MKRKKLFLLSLSLTIPFAHLNYLQARESDNSAVIEVTKEETKTEEKINALLAKMTIEEKVGQLLQPIPFKDNSEPIKEALRRGEIGSFTIVKKTPMEPEFYNELQKVAVEESRLGIPMFFGLDVIHGFNTMYPNPLAMASSWDDALVERAAALAASEAAPMGADVTYSPNVDICRDPRWGRIAETPGEDVLIASRMGAATVRGYQGSDLSAPNTMAACVKHLVGYGAAMGGRDKQFTEISDRTLLDVYLPSFEAAANAGASSFMAAFNDISGVPASANRYVMTELLREKWGFDGFVLSDWDSVIELMNHGVVAGTKDAASTAINAGLDVEMNSTCFSHIPELIKEGKVSMDVLDEAVRRVLRIKYRLGLFDNPYRDVKAAYAAQMTDENRQAVREIASQTMVLLKNEGRILPLAENSSIAVTGQMTHTKDLYGHWKGYGDMKDVVTPFEGLVANKLKGMSVEDATINEVNADIAVVCIGEESKDFGESDNMADITLQPQYIKAVKDAKAKYKKVVVVVFCGRPVVLTPIVDDADAILIAWHPGTEAGNALSDVLYGKVNPSAKTVVSFLKHSGQVPIFYSDRLSGRPRNNFYNDVDANPLYPFGFGLNYSYLTYSKMRVSSNSMSKDGSITVSVNIHNQGMDCYEVVQLYTHDIVASVTRPLKELKDYKKVFIKKGETKVVSFELKASQLAFHNLKLEKVVEPGEFDLWVGSSSANEDLQHKSFVVTE
ncbi:MAG: glycoside hydrolase family 3 N-terminal domain-containing protein [Rikenellaceae bacterium]